MRNVLVLAFLLFACLVIACCVAEEGSSLARGFNEKIHWVSYEDGLKRAKEENKPAFVLLHKSWCGACKRLKPAFAGSTEVEQLSEKFVMINAEDDEEPHANPAFALDGSYIPRIIFMSAEGTVLPEIYNEGGNAKYKYFYSSPEQIVTVMNKALSHVESLRLQQQRGDEL
ncbi:Thioredoxin domain-containing protein 12 [Balamuthia mandrillaris]